MSMWERSHDANLVTRNRKRQDAQLAALRARGHSPLEANFRLRVRGGGRSPLRPHGVGLTASRNGEGRLADVDEFDSTNQTAQRPRKPIESGSVERAQKGSSKHAGNGGSENAEANVFVFPEILLPPPEKPVRGPLSWAYWSARRK